MIPLKCSLPESYEIIIFIKMETASFLLAKAEKPASSFRLRWWASQVLGALRTEVFSFFQKVIACSVHLRRLVAALAIRT